MTCLTVITGVRTTHYQWWKFGDIRLTKVPMRGGRVVDVNDAAADAAGDDPTNSLAVRTPPRGRNTRADHRNLAVCAASDEWTRVVGVQAGFALVTNLTMDKAPNSCGQKMMAVDPIGQRTDANTPLAGNSVVELGLVMGAYDAGELAALQYEEELRPRPHAKEWYGAAKPLRCLVRERH